MSATYDTPARSTRTGVPASTKFFAKLGAALVALGFVVTLWQKTQASTPSTQPLVLPEAPGNGYTDGSLLDLQAIVPNLGWVVLGVIALAMLVAYKSRPSF